jgi:hypothetical protein
VGLSNGRSGLGAGNRAGTRSTNGSGYIDTSTRVFNILAQLEAQAEFAF